MKYYFYIIIESIFGVYVMQITPYSFEYWVISSAITLLVYLAGIFLDFLGSRKNELSGLYKSLAVIAYLTGLFVAASIALQYVGVSIINYMQTNASSDIAAGTWENAFFPWVVPPIITTVTGIAFIAITIVGITAFRIGMIYHKLRGE